MKSDERSLIKAARIIHAGPYKQEQHNVPFLDEIGSKLGIHPKRVNYLALKWSSRGYWDYGVSVRSGWFTPEGYNWAASIR